MNSLIRQSSRLALAALKKNKLRTFLSVLGTAIGITSIVVILSAGQSLRQIFDDELKSFGTDYIEVEIKVPNTGANSADNAAGQVQGISITTLSLDDKEDIDKLSNVAASYGAVLGQSAVTSAFEDDRLNYFAISSEFQYIDPTEIESGRFFTKDEENSLDRVVVLGSKAAEQLFPNQDPVGQSVKLQKTRFKVLGVYKERGGASFFDMDNMIFVPLRTAQKLLLGFDHLLFIFAKLHDVSQSDLTAEDIRQQLRANHDISDPAKDDFAVSTQAEASATVNLILNGVTIVLSIIASVALLVGGVGIMNIMYVAVNERVFEIGLRKALGAPGAKIRSQFLVEAIIVTLFGGLAGLFLAIVIILLVYLVAGWQGFNWPFAISSAGIFIAVVFSSAIGLIFAYFPAKRAAALRPVEALMTKVM